MGDNIGRHDEIRRFVMKETMVSALINGGLTSFTTWMMFSGRERAPVWGMDGLAFDLLPSTFFPVLLMGLILPLVIKARLRSGNESGKVPKVDHRDLARYLGFWGRLAPRSMIARAVLLAAFLACLVAPIGFAALWVSGLTSASLTSVLIGKAVWGGMVGMIACPLILLPAAAR